CLAGVSAVLGYGDEACFPTAAEPFVPSRGEPAWNTGCDRHMAVHDRLDVIEETVEKTVEHLETELKGLLGQLEELAWNLPPGPSGPTPDLLGDGEWLGWQRTAWAGDAAWTSWERAWRLLQRSWGASPNSPCLFSALSPAWGRCSLAPWSGLLEELAQFTWGPRSSALDAEFLPPPRAIRRAQNSCTPLRSHARPPSWVTTDPSDGVSERVAPCSFAVPCVPWHRSSVDWEGRGGERRAGGLQHSSAAPSLSDRFGAPEPELPSSWK
ncbi:unnamed protein product, partial [Gulo gulo]